MQLEKMQDTFHPISLLNIAGTFESLKENNFTFPNYLEKFKNTEQKLFILYFYPKDNTPGCTTQAIDFRNNYQVLQEKNIQVIGVSRDTLASHQRFSEKLGLPFDLIADTQEILCQQFDVIKAKKMYGKDVRGIQRSTFIYNADGLCIEAWRNVKANTHIEEILALVSTL